MTDSATAFVPGHLTLFFSVVMTDTPATTGSRGGGITIREGVYTSVQPGEGIAVNETPTSIEPVERVLDALDVSASVQIETTLELGTGFGVSGAAALGAAIAANEAFDCRRTENELIRLAHIAEVEAQTGLGDVIAQARGGIPIRIEPGAPDVCELDGLTARPGVEYLSLGPVSTSEVLGGDVSTLSEAGERALEKLRGAPSIDHMFDLGWEFTREAGLYDDEVASIVESVHELGGHAAVGHLGRTVVALEDGLTRAGYDPTVTVVDAAGGTLLSQ